MYPLGIVVVGVPYGFTPVGVSAGLSTQAAGGVPLGTVP
jgi:hypothetical protein